tara:strand:- start:27 stop:410 length:384 start_codon:yes stop_codon:yes gene_type:complete
MPRTRKQYNDGLTGLMVLESLITFTTTVANGDCADNREQFDSILVSTHNADMPAEKQITAAYVQEQSLRVSQKFSQIKQKFKDLGNPINLSLPRRTRSVGMAQVDKMKKLPNWAQFAKLNAAAGKKK